MKRKYIFKSIYGSKLFGVDRPGSDTDYKSIFIPSSKEIILGNYKKISVVQTGSGEDKVDTEEYSLQSFLRKGYQSQTFVYDLIFTPDDMILHKTKEWDYIRLHRKKLITSNVRAFIGFALGQANKYQIKGGRLEDLDRFIDLLTKNKDLKLKEIKGLDSVEGVTSFLDDKNTKNYRILGKVCPEGSKGEILLTTLTNVRKRYGQRTLQSYKDGLDNKSFYHALRLCFEAKEILQNGEIKFPLEKADFLKKVRRNEFSIDELTNLIDENMKEIQDLKKVSSLPDSVDQDFWEDFIYRCYRGNI